MNNGAFQIARKIFESELWIRKPASWSKIWIYILGRVNYKSSTTCERGEGFFNFKKELENIGTDITTDKIKKFTKYALQNGMISTRRSTRGMYIKVLKYPIYQDLSSYQAPNEAPQKPKGSTSEALVKHFRSTPIVKKVIKKERKNTYSSAFESFWKLYPKKKEKPEAYKAWNNLKPSSELQVQIKEAVKQYKETEDWKKEGGRYIVFPERFLKKKRWEDEIISDNEVNKIWKSGK